MKAQILFDKRAQQAHLFTGWGFACIVDNILFDTGENGEWLLTNINRLQYSLLDVEAVVISHDHWDHWGGLWMVLEKHPGLTVYGCPGFSNDFKQKVADCGGVFTPVADFTELKPGIFSTGELIGTYKNTPISEQSLVVKSEAGVSVITGCAHPGIVTIAEAVREQFPREQLNAIMGGFHLYKKSSGETDRILAELADMGFQRIGGSHCTGDYGFEQSNLKLYVGTEVDV
jgi:7,8-dihydropterin-6-yl-methyl-4-(beta-D-ribofuranosyl)aminobenzene 5'-phosphate synthase